jgi:hypothetical protein
MEGMALWVDHHPKKDYAAFGGQTKKAAPQGSICNLGDKTDPKKVGLWSAGLNFAVGFGAVLVAVQMFLAGRGLGHANGEQRHKAGGGDNKTGKHAGLATVATT